MPLAASARCVAVVLAAAVVALAAAAGPAMAACPPVAVSNPFAAWGDHADYQPVPGGDVEDGGASWSVSGGAGAWLGSETFTDDGDISMRLPTTSSKATTARMCMGAEHPTFRFFVRRSGGTAGSRLVVEVVADSASGREHVLQSGLIAAAGAWAPSPVLPTMVEHLVAAGSDAARVSLRFRSQGGGVWSVDDVYVDPFRGT